MKTKAADILRKFFHDLRFDKDHHLGIGDVRVTFGQQEDIVSKLEACEPIKTPCCGVALSGSALQPYPVYWNPHNGVVQCHCCGTIYDPRNSKPNMTIVADSGQSTPAIAITQLETNLQSQ